MPDRVAETTNAPKMWPAAMHWRLRAYSVAYLAAILLGLIAATIIAEMNARPDGNLGGDYPAFYAAGRIVADGDIDRLYEVGRQSEAQAFLRSAEDAGEVRYYAYPPQVAVAYALLAQLSYPVSYLVHTLLMAAMLLAALLLIRPMVPWIAGKVVPVMAAAMLFWPMFRAVTGGSNPALTLLLIVAGWRLAHEERPFLAGLVLSGLFYKPQFAVPLLGLFLLGRYWRVVAGAAVGAAVFITAGAALTGPAWLFDWVEIAADFGRVDADVNGFSAISWLGFVENLFGVGEPVSLVLGWGLALATTAAISWLWLRSGGIPLDALLGLAMPALLLLSPHALSHDGAVILLTVAVMVQHVGRRALPYVIVLWVLGASQMWISTLGFSPGFFMVLLVAWWAARTLVPIALAPRQPAVTAAASP